MLKTKEVAIHISLWVLYITFAIFVYGFNLGSTSAAIFETTGSYLILIGQFYIHAFVLLPFFLGRKKTLTYIISVVLLFAFNFTIKYVGGEFLLPAITGSPSSASGLPIVRLTLVYSWQLIPFFIYSAGYWLAKKIIRQQVNAREEDRIKSENEKLILENAALRAQINPHFFVNTMEHFRYQIKSSHPEVSEGIEAMTNFVGSSIVATDSNGKIPLFDEVRAMESLITIFQMRYPKANIEYTIEVEDDVPVIPHMLVAPVENAFKHGSYTDPGSKLVIHLEQTEKDLIFKVSNKKGRPFKDKSRGIGMRYIKSQLDKSYPDQHSLEIQDHGEHYNLSLIIQNIMKDADHLLYH